MLALPNQIIYAVVCRCFYLEFNFREKDIESQTAQKAKEYSINSEMLLKTPYCKQNFENIRPRSEPVT